ncbi:MAG: hypothetical protein CMO73_11770 [Verrucomicrobiales bacterium]|nr:hypothetical protein [Verrucomicrobiales bacterium]
MKCLFENFAVTPVCNDRVSFLVISPDQQIPNLSDITKSINYNGNSGSCLLIPEQLTMNYGSGLGLAKWFLASLIGLVIILKWKRELKRNVLSSGPLA